MGARHCRCRSAKAIHKLMASRISVSPRYEANSQLEVVPPQTVPAASNEIPIHGEISGNFTNASPQMTGHLLPGQRPDVPVPEQTVPNVQAAFLLCPPPPPPPLGCDAKDLHALQEKLRDSREALVGARFRLHTRRRELRDFRQQTSAQIGAAFNLFKQHLLSQNTPLPSQILRSLQEVDEWRDKLGNVETDYDDEEERYNRQEWSYTQLEEILMDNLPDGAIITHTLQPRETQAIETDFVTRFADATADIMNYSNLDELVQMSLEERQRPSEQGNRTLAGPTKIDDHISCFIPRGARSHQDRSANETQTLLPRSFSEADLDTARLQWSNIRYRINEWLLGNLKSSTLQQQRLRDALSHHSLRDRDWFQTVNQHWYSDSPHGSFFHTGDTTVSDSTGDQPMPQPAGAEMRDIPLKDQFKTEELTFLRNDAQDDAARFPLPASMSNLSDAGQTTIFPETPTESHLHSMPGTNSQADVLSGLHITQEGICPSTSISDPDSGCKTTNTEISQHDAVCLENEGEVTGHINYQRHDSAFPDGRERRENTLLESHARNQGAQNPVQQSSQLFIHVLGSESWNLPLLRLTPVAQGVQRLDCIPFVSLPDTPFCLPGPPKF